MSCIKLIYDMHALCTVLVIYVIQSCMAYRLRAEIDALDAVHYFVVLYSGMSQN